MAFAATCTPCIHLVLKRGEATAPLARSMMSQLYIALPMMLMQYIYALSSHLVLMMFVLIWVK